MAGQQNLYTPEGFKIENNLQIENALKQKFVTTADERYDKIRKSFFHIKDTLRIPVGDLNLKEEVEVNGYVWFNQYLATMPMRY